jgi:hypothetical protein
MYSAKLRILICHNTNDLGTGQNIISNYNTRIATTNPDIILSLKISGSVREAVTCEPHVTNQQDKAKYL